MAAKDGKTRDHPKSRDALLKAMGSLGALKIEPPKVSYTPTGIVSLDIALHGGLPKGKMILHYGNRDTGKSTTWYLVMREILRRGRRAMLVDSERSATIEYLRLLGYTDDMLALLDLVTVQTLEGYWDLTMAALESGLYDLIVLDTLAKLSPSTELASSSGKVTMGVSPQINSRATRQWGNLLADSGCTVVVLNQERANLTGYGSPNLNPGGKAIEFEAGVILYMMKAITDNPEESIFRYRIERSKVFYSPSRKIEYELHVAHQDGIHEVSVGYEIYTGAKAFGILKDKNGAVWQKNVAFFGELNLGNGEAQVLKWFETPSPDRDQIEALIYEAIEHGTQAKLGVEAEEPLDQAALEAQLSAGETDDVLSDT